MGCTDFLPHDICLPIDINHIGGWQNHHHHHCCQTIHVPFSLHDSIHHRSGLVNFHSFCVNLSFLSQFIYFHYCICIKHIMCVYICLNGCTVNWAKLSNKVEMIAIITLKEWVYMSVDVTIFSQECLWKRT